MTTHHSTNKAEILWQHVFKVVSDEHSSNVKLDPVGLLGIVGEQVRWGSLKDITSSIMNLIG